MGEKIANTRGFYEMWMITNLVSNSGLSKAFDIPIFSGNLLESARLGIVGGTGILALAEGLKGLLSGERLSLNGWNANETLVRGSGETSIVTKGIGTRTSSSMYIGDTSSAVKQSITQTREDYAQYTGATEEETSIKLLIENRVESHLINIYNLLSGWDTRLIMKGGIE